MLQHAHKMAPIFDQWCCFNVLRDVRDTTFSTTFFDLWCIAFTKVAPCCCSWQFKVTLRVLTKSKEFCSSMTKNRDEYDLQTFYDLPKNGRRPWWMIDRLEVYYLVPDLCDFQANLTTPFYFPQEYQYVMYHVTIAWRTHASFSHCLMPWNQNNIHVYDWT